MSEATARWGGEWADGLATVNAPVEHAAADARRVRRRDGRGACCRSTSRGRRPTRRRCAIAHDQWRTNVFDPPVCWDLDTPEAFDVAAALRAARGRARRRCSSRSDLQQHVAWLQEFAALGFDDIALHHVGQDLDPFIDAFGEHVLPALR